MNIFQKVTLKALKENKTRTIVTIIGIILSLSMFTAVTVSLSSFLNYLLEITQAREGNWHGSVTLSAQDCFDLLSDKQIDTISFLEHIGYAKAEGCSNPDKPYLFIGGMDEHALGTLPIILTEGRIPENENELLLPAHLSYNGGVHYHLQDTLTLEIGQRTSLCADGTSVTLQQDTPYLYTEAELKAQGVPETEISLKDTEALMPQSTRTFTVVGFYQRPAIEPYTAPGYTALTVSQSSAITAASNEHAEAASSDIYTAYIRFKHPKDAIPWMQSNYPDSDSLNYDLLRMYVASYESSYNAVLYGLSSILIFIILFGSVSLIHNAFSISVTERTRQFGLLASLGATKKQLVHSVLFEALTLCAIGIPVGVLAGIAGIGVTFSLLGTSISSIFWDDWAVPLTLYVSPWAVVGAILLGLFTVLISAYLPARRAARLSPMDAIRMTADIHIKSKKVRTSPLTYKLFGLPGMLASKNFKRNRRKYRATVFSLFVSIVLFISASSYCSYLMKSASNILADTGYDIAYFRRGETYDFSISNEQLFHRFQTLDSIENAAYIQTDIGGIYMNREDLSQDYLDFLQVLYPYEIKTPRPEQVFVNTELYFVNDAAFFSYLEDAGLSAADFSNPQKPAAVAFDFLRSYDGNRQKYLTFHILTKDHAKAGFFQANAPEGLSFSGSFIGEDSTPVYYFSDEEDSTQTVELSQDSCSTPVTLSIQAVPDTPPFFLGEYNDNGLVLMYPYSVMEQVLGADWTAHLKDNTTRFLFTASDYQKASEDISSLLESLALDYGSVVNFAESAAQERTLLLVISVFSYGFIILISLIAMANVFHTISTNIQLRKREFAMLKSIGLTPRGFTVMMCYECLLYGLKGLLYGLPVSILITYAIYRSVYNGWELSFYIPWYSLVIAIGSVFLVVGSTMLYSMHKIKRENIMDNLKRETV